MVATFYCVSFNVTSKLFEKQALCKGRKKVYSILCTTTNKKPLKPMKNKTII